MSAIVIEHLSDTSLVPQVEEIFFESSTKKKFESAKEKEQFKWKYLGFYLSHYPELVWIARNDEQVLGYCLGAPHSDAPELFSIQPHLEVFKEEFKRFPAHLHINIHFEARGQGIGQKLIKEFENDLQRFGIRGVHLMTGTDARNRSFYHRLGYNVEIIHSYLGRPILLMGKKLKEIKL